MQKKQEIIIIAAMAENRVIGKDGTLPWSIKEDLAHFKALTTGWPCIMGRKTWESLPFRPLPGRLNIIVSGTMNAGCKQQDNIKIFSSLQAAVEHCAGYDKIFICGGAAIYREALSLANKIELTVIHGQYEGDVFFPEIDVAAWTKTGTENFDSFSFDSYSKTGLL